MARSHGWSVLAETALELAALALVLRAMDWARGRAPARVPRAVEVPRPEPAVTVPAAPIVPPSPSAFISEDAGDDARYYRAADENGEIVAGFYADGRVRLARGDHRFAGAVESGRADLLDVANNAWCELLVRTTPDDRLQLELRGGPYDACIFTCDPFDPARMT